MEGKELLEKFVIFYPMLLVIIETQKKLDNSNRKAKEISLPESVGERQWGQEILLVLSEGKYTMKKLIINKGVSGGLQYHRKKMNLVTSYQALY